jgi:hypothetical protein
VKGYHSRQEGRLVSAEKTVVDRGKSQEVRRPDVGCSTKGGDFADRLLLLESAVVDGDGEIRVCLRQGKLLKKWEVKRVEVVASDGNDVFLGDFREKREALF